MAKVNNFDVLKRMSSESKDIHLGTTVTDLNYSAKLGGTKVSIGIPGNIAFEINSGKLHAVLLVFDMAQFNEIKAQMESSSSPASQSPEVSNGK